MAIVAPTIANMYRTEEEDDERFEGLQACVGHILNAQHRSNAAVFLRRVVRLYKQSRTFSTLV